MSGVNGEKVPYGGSKFGDKDSNMEALQALNNETVDLVCA